jgi:hypothetical protein
VAEDVAALLLGSRGAAALVAAMVRAVGHHRIPCRAVASWMVP